MTRRAATIGSSLAGLPFIVPHAVEDFAEGIAQRVGLATGVGAFLLGSYLALQGWGLVLVMQGRPAGWIVTFWTSAIWTVGAVVDHGPAVLAGRFRSGGLSLVWLLGLLLSQGTAAALAWRGWRPDRAP